MSEIVKIQSNESISIEDFRNKLDTNFENLDNLCDTRKVTSQTQFSPDKISSDKIKNNAVTKDKILNSAVTEDELATDSVTTNKIQNGAVAEEKLDGDLQILMSECTPIYITNNANDIKTIGKYPKGAVILYYT